MSTMPMISPDGDIGDVPLENVPAAVKSGFKVGQDMLSPDGRAGTVPLEKVHDAIKAGFQVKGAPPAKPAGPNMDEDSPQSPDIDWLGHDKSSPTPSLANRSNQYRAVDPSVDAAKDRAFSENHPIVHAMVHGLGEAAGDVVDAANPVNIAKGAWDNFPPVAAYKNIQDTIPVIKAFHAAREAGKSVSDSLTVANDVANQHNQVRQAIEDRAGEFKKTPGQATIRALGDAAALGASFFVGGGEAGEAGEEATGGEAAAKPGIVKQIVKGKNVAQPAAEEALQTAAGTKTPSLRESLSEPINTSQSQAKALYGKIDDAAGADFKGLANKIQNANRKIRMAATPEEEAQWESQRSAATDAMEDAKELARSRGVDPKVLDQADAEYKRMSALTDVEKRVFKNTKVVKGNAAQGTPETIDIDRAVDELQKLQDSEKYGAPRLEQAFGKDGASQLLRQFYDAQRQGIHAMKMQQAAKWVAGITGAGAAAKSISAIGSIGKDR